MIKRLLDYNDGEDMDLVLLLKDSSLRTSKNGKQYLVLQFSDSSGTIREIFGMLVSKMLIPSVQALLLN